MSELFDRELVVVTGKGGTGKTTVATALARLAAKAGKRVLLCQTDPSGDIGAALSVDSVGFDPVEVAPGLFVMAMDTEAALQEYLRLNLKLPFAVRLGPLAKVFDFVATAAPGVREILTVGKLSWDVKRKTYDIVVVDAAATGHIVSQLGSPDSIGELVSVGPLTSQTAWMRELLRDPARTGAVIVTTPEEMPVSETLQLSQQLRDVTQTPLAAIVVNRVLPELFVRDELNVFEALANEPWRGRLNESVPGDVDSVIAATQLAVSLRQSQVEHLNELRDGIDAEVPLVFVPQSFGPDDPQSIGNEVFDALAGELEQ